ncbi:MAG: hypothetical protein FGM57_01775 [Candidatus Taylorbacteria bacterium]|nr:hypothetical protein [Candidatus Taylorbacteria bacterium]
MTSKITKYIKNFGIFAVTAVVLIVGTALSTRSGEAQTGNTSIPPQRLVGYAWSENIGWISFNDGSKPVTVDAQGNLDGFAWSENIGWVKFGNWSSVPDSTRGTNSRLSGSALSGWARAVAGMTNSEIAAISPDLNTGGLSAADNRGGWDGWISLQGVTLSGSVSGNPPAQKFTGYAWGSDVVGWVEFDKVSLTSNLNSCTGPYGTVIADGQSFTYFGAQADDGSCQSEERSCVNGVLSGSFTEISCGDDTGVKKELVCTRAGKVLKEGETIDLYSRSSVKAGTSCAPFKDKLTCKAGKFIGSDGMQNTDHVFLGCRPLPAYLER